MQFEQTHHLGKDLGDKIDRIEYETLKQARISAHIFFTGHTDAVVFEERKFTDGTTQFTIKHKSGKIILKLKEVADV